MSDVPPADQPEKRLLVSVELVGDDQLYTALGTVEFEDPAVWGEVFANVAKHVAQSLHRREGIDEAATLRAIAEAFGRELAGGGEAGGGE